MQLCNHFIFISFVNDVENSIYETVYLFLERAKKYKAKRKYNNLGIASAHFDQTCVVRVRSNELPKKRKKKKQRVYIDLLTGGIKFSITFR